MAQDPKEILIQHGEKVALGLVALAAAVVVLTSSTGEAQKLNDKIKESSAKIQQLSAKGYGPEHAKIPKVADPLPALQKPIGPVAVAIPDSIPWTYNRKPPVQVTSTEGPPPIVAPNIKLDSIRATASREKIEISWDSPPRRAVASTDQVERDACRQLGWVLYKWRKGQEDKPKVTFYDASTTSLNDTEFEPETGYSYKVRAYWEFKREGPVATTPEIHPAANVTQHEVAEDGALKGKTVWATEWSAPTTVTTALNIGLAFISRAGDTATVCVWQFWRGNWWRVAFKVNVGESIGRMVSPQDLVEDAYNKERHASVKDFQDMLALQATAADKFKAPTYAWKSGYVYFGHGRESRADAEHVQLEHHEVAMRGANGIAWGTRMTRILKSKGDAPPDQAAPSGGGGSGSGS